MAAVETKVPGYFTDKMTIGDGTDDADGFGTKTLVLKVCVRAEREKGSVGRGSPRTCAAGPRSTRPASDPTAHARRRPLLPPLPLSPSPREAAFQPSATA